MAVHYDVPAGKTFMIAGPANVTVKGGEFPAIVDDVADAQAEAPVLISLDPSEVENGPDAPDVVLTVTGDRLNAESVIIFNGFDEPTTFTEAGTVTTIVRSSIFGAGPLPVSVRNGPLHSNSLDFTLVAPAPEAASSKKRRS
jgi:hypothetical protein